MSWKIGIVILEAYLLGSIPFGYLLYRLTEGGDVRATGSGNIGATNVLRSAGLAAGCATLVLDAGKGFLAVVLAGALTGGTQEWMGMAAVIAVLGHMFPLFLKFRGGKGVATGLGTFLALAPLPVLASVCVFVVVAAIWRYISLGSIIAVSVFPLILLVHAGTVAYFPAALASAALIVWRHRPNIQRLRLGAETAIQIRHHPLRRGGEIH